ncbi:MAG: PLP-dependent aminotransferase family protein [Desulfopila sp.]|jgi:DNA-binding transcriptional MocR family regulator|nr:PLP-dependent aminotransferase family protein [Desulfopila sp.]
MSETHLYKKIADRIAGLVEKGTFKAGDKVPSIRELSRQAQVSINTVKIAYGHLEDRCIIEARPQSGYYVCPKAPELPREPIIDRDSFSPVDISSSELVVRIMRDTLDPAKVQFGAAIPDPHLMPAEKLGRILAAKARTHKIESASYSIPPGSRKLRSHIGKWMIKAGCTLTPEDIIITSGAAEAVYLALQVICRPGDTVAIGTPIYFNFVEMFKLLGLRVIEIPNSPVDGLQLELLEHALKENDIACCLVISNFDNPLGSCLSDERKKALVTLLHEYDVPLIEDDINGDLSFADDRPSVAKAWDRSGKVLLCSSFSKTLAPGYRIGWIAPGKFKDAILQRKLVTNVACASPTQLAIAEFLENGGYAHHLRTIRKAYAAKLAQLSDAIAHAFPQGTRVTRPNGGFILWLELPESYDAMKLYAAAAKKKITIAPGSIFSITQRFSNCLRLNGAYWSEENRWAVEELGSLAKAQAAGLSI